MQLFDIAYTFSDFFHVSVERIVDTTRSSPLRLGGETYSRWKASGYFPTLEQAVGTLTDLQLRDSKQPQAEVHGLGVSGAMTFF